MSISAALRMAAIHMDSLDGDDGIGSCFMAHWYYPQSGLTVFSDLMSPNGSANFGTEVHRAAKRAKWTTKDFRTFMLLMASVALK